MLMRCALALVVTSLLVGAAKADSLASRCEFRPAGSLVEAEVLPCMFSQSQGHVTISIEDGPVYDLTPVEGVGNFVDAEGGPVYRNSGLGDEGLIFTLEDGQLFVYWGR